MKLLKKIYQERLEKREALRKEVLEKVIHALEEFSKEVAFKRAIVFGSVVKPYGFSENSDVDLAFEGLEKDKLFYAIAFFSSFLEREVDVVELEKIKFKEKILKEGLIWKRD